MNRTYEFLTDETVRLAFIEAALEKSLPQQQTLYHKLTEAMRYSLLNGGKRVRASLMLFSGQCFSLEIERLLPYLVALEMIHAYSLIHDDLPAMDDDDMRRGKPSCHIRYGEGMAILAGDGLLNQAMEILITSCRDGKTATEASLYLAKSAGLEGMIGGQAVDLDWTERTEETPDAEDLYFLQDRKTAALLRAAVMIPAILAESSETVLRHCEKFATALGHVFQIVDDLLDVQADPQVLGKSTGKDQRDGKLTAVTVYGLSGAEKKAEEWNCLAEEALRNLRDLSYDTHSLEIYAERLLRRSK